MGKGTQSGEAKGKEVSALCRLWFVVPGNQMSDARYNQTIL